MKSSFPLSQKYIDFINTVKGVDAEFLEGTTASGKTTIGAGVKFMRMVSISDKKLHIIASKSTGIAEKNIIQQDNGILDLHRTAVYCGNGDKDYKIPHIKFENKIIFIIGYGDRSKWEMVLGSQFGCVYIDEVNTANIDFVREISTRNQYLLATLNPDNPDLPIYKEFINRSRPYKKYRNDVPAEILAELTQEPVPNWRYWFFTFRDNLGLSEEEIQKKIDAAPKGTKLYKNKILGLRGKATGLVFPNFDKKKHVVSRKWIKEQLEKNAKNRKEGFCFVHLSAGLDTSYSQASEDTVAMIFQGITNTGILIILAEEVRNNKYREIPFAPSDIAEWFNDFLLRSCREWGMLRNVFIDSADQATITELMKYARKNGSSFTFNNAYKKVAIIDRINLQLGWLQHEEYLVLDECPEHIRELEIYSWQEEKDIPEDKNDHTINASQYGWIPYRHMIGVKK